MAYVWSNDVWVLDVASGGSVKVAACGPGCTLAWSPDGSVIALTHGDGLELVRPDGTERMTVPASSGFTAPAWSPDGQQLALRGRDDLLYTMDRDGTDLQSVGVSAWAAAWSPDGSRIAYLFPTDCQEQCTVTVGTVDPHGSNPTELIRAGRCYCLGFWPGLTWSPDGTQMALVIPGPGQSDLYGLYVVNEDGTGLRLLREGAWGRPAWEPAP